MTPITTAPVRVRFAPSPTGPMTLGGARTVLFNWLFARQHKGVFILRIEDTDKDRSNKAHEPIIAKSLLWLGLEWDEGPEITEIDGTVIVPEKGEHGPYRQTERLPLYRRYLTQLIEEGKAYYCYCTKEELDAQVKSLETQGLPPKYSGHCRNLTKPPEGKTPETIRFKMPQAAVEFKDLVRGAVKFDADLFGDVIIAKDLDTPLYNFAVVVDDELMNISHVIRGEEHLSNTPKQILFARALGFHEPIFAHLPLMLGTDKKKLSKRTAEVSMLDYERRGYLPEAMVNFLALLGWHPSGDQEIFKTEELINEFDIRRLQKAGAIFNEEKLAWLNAQHLRLLSVDELVTRLRPLLLAREIDASDAFLKKVIAVERERASTLNDFMILSGFFFALPDYEPALLVWKNDTSERAKEALLETLQLFEAAPHDKFEEKNLREILSPLIEKYGRGTVLWPLRVAVSGLAASPDPFQIIEILGKKETLVRIRVALNKFGLTI